MWKHTRDGRHYLTDHARDYYKMVALHIRQQTTWTNLDIAMQVHCELSPPDNRRRDLDNAWKVIADSLTKAGLWQDDKFVRRLVLEWMPKTERGAVRLLIGKHVEKTLT